MSTTDLRVIKTKQALHSALLTLLSQKPLEQISIAEICREAKVNRGHSICITSKKKDSLKNTFKRLWRIYTSPTKNLTVP